MDNVSSFLNIEDASLAVTCIVYGRNILNMAGRYEKDSLIVTRKIGNELILVPIRQNVGDLQCIYTLNEVASRIWQLIDGVRTVEEIASVLTQEYEVQAQEAEADVVDFLTQMKDIEAIVEKPDGG